MIFLYSSGLIRYHTSKFNQKYFVPGHSGKEHGAKRYSFLFKTLCPMRYALCQSSALPYATIPSSSDIVGAAFNRE
jgi:hypothetical protein